MSTEKPGESTPEKPGGPPTPSEKSMEHKERILRTVIACFMGIAAGILSFTVAGEVNPETGLQANAIVGWLLLLAGIVFQKHVFIITRIDYTKLGGKDWFYQGFMTFALWFISWTVLLNPFS
ncbi:MAG: hypothetical protein APR53_06120 [Methanoculleus sp. SDB]|nr:MAG: hypothetical protein APR53_06120 [Methanoculleus sp. SDB]